MSAGILFATWGSLGDVHPTLAIAGELRRRGHAPAVATLAMHRDAVTAAGLEFFPLRPEVPSDAPSVRRLVARLFDRWNGPRHLWSKLVLPALRDAYDDLMAAVSAMADCRLLVSHPLTPAVRLVAEKLGLPWLATVLQPAGLLSVFDPPAVPPLDRIQPWAARHPALARLLLRLGRAATRDWGRQVSRVRRDVGLPPCEANPALEGQYSPHGVLALFPPELCPPRPDHPPATLWTGLPLYHGGETPPAELLDFLDHGQAPLLFTLGSSAVWVAGDFFRSAALAAQRLGRRALLLTGGETVGVPLPASMMALPYAPHGLVMPRAAAVVHHGGVGTTAQALRAGKPQLIVPHGLDQPDNARRCCALGVAQVLDRRKVTPRRLADHLAGLLDDDALARRAADFGERLAQRDGASEAADAIERAMPGAAR